MLNRKEDNAVIRPIISGVELSTGSQGSGRLIISGKNGENHGQNHKEQTVTLRWGVRRPGEAELPDIYDLIKQNSVNGHVYINPTLTPLFAPNLPPSFIQKPTKAELKSLREFLILQSNPFKMWTQIPRIPESERDPDRVYLEPHDRQVDERRVTRAIMCNDKVVATRSLLTRDPYAPEKVQRQIDDGELSVAYGHALITKDDSHTGLMAITALADVAFGRDEDEAKEMKNQGAEIFEQMSGLVNMLKDPSWLKVRNLFEYCGYEPDDNPEGKFAAQIGEYKGKPIIQPMQRVVVTRRRYHRARPRLKAHILRKHNVDIDKFDVEFIPALAA